MDLMQFFELFAQMDGALARVIAEYGRLIYAILFVVILLETGVVPFAFLPGDSLLFVVGALCAAGDMRLDVVMPLLIGAAVAGNLLNYATGRFIGNRLLAGNSRWFDQSALRTTRAFYGKHGGKTIVVARFIPLLRTFAPFVAGVCRMPGLPFHAYTLAGALVWVVSLTGGGYLFGQLPGVREHLHVIIVLAIAAAALPLVAGGVWRVIVKRRVKCAPAEF